MSWLKEHHIKEDVTLWIVIAILCGISILAVFSSTLPMAYQSISGGPLDIIKHHLIFIGTGLLLMWGTSLFYPTFVLRLSKAIMIICLVLSILVYVPGIGVRQNEANRWVNIGGIIFCPFDFLKIATVLYLTVQLSKYRAYINKINLSPVLRKKDLESGKSSFKINGATIKILGLPIMAVGIVLLANLSSVVIMGGTILIMLIIGNVNAKSIKSLIVWGASLGLVVVSIMIIFNIGRGASWRGRIGIGSEVVEQTNSVDLDDSYQMTIPKRQIDKDYQKQQARIAMASGGLLGKGAGKSTQRSILPHSYDDYVYAFIVEEYGLMGGIAVLILYVILFARGQIIAVRSTRYAYRLMVYGLISNIILTAGMHMLVSTGYTLSTGQTLPLISKGGSSLYANFIALGLILGASRFMKSKSVENENNN